MLLLSNYLSFIRFLDNLDICFNYFGTEEDLGNVWVKFLLVVLTDAQPTIHFIHIPSASFTFINHHNYHYQPLLPLLILFLTSLL